MEKSETVAKLAKALNAAQKTVMKAELDASNPFFKSKYATLDSVWEACRGPLTENGLSVVQLPGPGNTLDTMILHESGEWVSNAFEIKPTKNDPQALGSAITYGRRYALSAVAGVVVGDDDGAQASNTVSSGAAQTGASAAAVSNKPAGTVSDKQVKRLLAIGRSNGWEMPHIKEYTTALTGATINDLHYTVYNKIIDTVQSVSPDKAITDLVSGAADVPAVVPAAGNGSEEVVAEIPF